MGAYLEPGQKKYMKEDERRKLVCRDDGNKPTYCSEISSRKAKRRASVLLAFVFVFFMAAFMIMVPTIQQYLYNRLLNEELNKPLVDTVWKNDTTNSIKSCGENWSSSAETIAQERSAQWMLYLDLAANVPGIFSTLIIGAFTDVRGRKVGLIVPAIGSLCRFIISILVVGLDWPIATFVVARIIEGCSGGTGAISVATYAYLADITEPGKERSLMLTIFQAAMGFGMSASAVGTGYLIEGSGFFYPLILGLGLILLTIVILFFLPETIKLRPDMKVPNCTRTLNAFSTYIRPRDEGKRWKLLALLVALFLVDMVQLGKSPMDVLFQLGVPFCWDSIRIGVYAAISVSVQIVSMLLLLRPLQSCLNDTVIGMLGSLSGVAQLILTGSAVSDVMLYLAPCIGFLYVVPSPMIKSVMSSFVGQHEQGCLFAGICSIQMMCFTFGSLMFNTVYMSTVATFAGFVFIVMAILYFLCFILLGAVEIFETKMRRTRRSWET